MVSHVVVVVVVVVPGFVFVTEAVSAAESGPEPEPEVEAALVTIAGAVLHHIGTSFANVSGPEHGTESWTEMVEIETETAVAVAEIEISIVAGRGPRKTRNQGNLDKRLGEEESAEQT